MEWVYALCIVAVMGLVACAYIIFGEKKEKFDEKKEKFDGELYVIDQYGECNAGVKFLTSPEDLIAKGRCVLRVQYVDENYGIKKGDE